MDPSGALWQPWADFLAYAALSALPWCGADLVVAAGGELQQVLAAAEVYMGQRPQQVGYQTSPVSHRCTSFLCWLARRCSSPDPLRCALQEDPLLRPYYGAGSAADAADAGDSGGASFLPLLLHMLQVGGRGNTAQQCKGPGSSSVCAACDAYSAARACRSRFWE